MAKPLVAIVGRPNVGKSTLFNKLVGKRISIVDDSPGVTRDRIYADCEWLNNSFTLIDTGGIELKTTDDIIKKIRIQAEVAIDIAEVIIFVTSIKDGVIPADYEIAELLQKSGKKVVLCVNKCDHVGSDDLEIYDFYNLGLGTPYGVSSVHGHGTGDLLEAVCDEIDFGESSSADDDYINVAIIGKPNAGKSSLLNKIIGYDRSIVSNVAGTTRDAIDIKYENEFGKFVFVDTAGLRKKSKVLENIEKYSNLRVKMAIDDADVCVLMIDAVQGITEQDTKVAGMAINNGKPCIVAINKWDAIEKDNSTHKEFVKDIETVFSFMSYAPNVFISAKTGQNLNKLFETIVFVNEQNNRRISTGKLNEILAEATSRVQPPTDKGKRLKIYYMTQASTKPPTFVFFVNDIELFHFSYKRYLENQIRSVFGLTGTPINFITRERNDK